MDLLREHDCRIQLDAELLLLRLLLLLLLEPEALSMYRECRRGALAQSRTLCSKVWPFRLEKSEGVLGNSGRKPEEAPGHSEWKPVGHSTQIKRPIEP